MNSLKENTYSMELNELINSTIKKILTYSNSNHILLHQDLKIIICSDRVENWILLRQILSNSQIKCKHTLLSDIRNQLNSLMRDQDINFVIFLFLYGWMIKSNTFREGMQRRLKQLTEQGKHICFISWLQDADTESAVVVETISMVIQHYTIIIKQDDIPIESNQLTVIINLVCRAVLKSVEQFQSLHQIGSVLGFYQRNNSSATIIKTLLSILANSENCTGTASWLLTEPFLKLFDLDQLELNYEELILYKQYQLKNIFRKLFQSSLEQNALRLFRLFTRAFKWADKFYELKVLYSKILLPIIIRRGKARIGLEEAVFSISSNYIIGFYQHCDIGTNGIICLIKNIDKVEEKSLQTKWIELAFLVSDKNRKIYKQLIKDQLIKQGFSNHRLDEIDRQRSFATFQDSHIWQITVRSARQLKMYPKRASKLFHGIENQRSQCYIISVLQALFTTRQLPQILRNFDKPKRQTLCFAMKDLFDKLQSKYSSRINVQTVKRCGPQNYTYSDHQEDAQQYLLNIFSKIQSELKESKANQLLSMFQDRFQTKVLIKFECTACHNIINKEEEQFIITIPNRCSLRQQQVEQINDYKCEKCKNKKILKKMQLRPTGKLLIFHMNRFSYHKNSGKKQLVTQCISRYFMGYRLKGIIFHIGKNIQFGHYVYYYCVAGKKWVQMNDSNVFEFNLDDEDEEFERQMKIEMTPYLLFFTLDQSYQTEHS